MTPPLESNGDGAALRADLVDTGDRWQRAGRIVIEAPADAVFDVLADPSQHALFDGSGSVQGSLASPERLALGSTFGMSMRIGLPYRIENTVVEFEEGRTIAWRHFNGHRWRYELEPTADGRSTVVTETFDGSTARIPASLLLINAYANNQTAILKTLVRLKRLVEGRAGQAS